MMVILFVIWSNSFTAIKHCREVFSPIELVAARFIPVAVFSLLYHLASARRRRETAGILKSIPLRIASMGFLGVISYNFFLYLGQSEIKPGAAALVTALAPLFTLVLAMIFLKERATARRITGVMTALAGMIIVVGWGRVGLGKMIHIDHADMIYMLIASLAPLSWSFYTILGKNLTQRLPASSITFLPIVIGSVPLMLVMTPSFFSKMAGMEASHWIALLYLIIFCTILGFYMWNLALRHLDAGSVASYIYLNPPMAALFGWLLFGEEVTVWFLAGGAVVLVGLYLAQKDNGSEPRQGTYGTETGTSPKTGGP
jgi:drug/metabolite transporter (DMT)-like permease